MRCSAQPPDSARNSLSFSTRQAGSGGSSTSGRTQRKHMVPKLWPTVWIQLGCPGSSWATASRMDPKIILEAVRNWNKLAKNTLHVIAVDEAKSIRMLRKLASENNGTYVAIPKN